MDKLINDLRKAYTHLENTQRLTERNLKYLIVCDVLLKGLGYDSMNFDFSSEEENENDIIVQTNTNDRLIILTKNVNLLDMKFTDQLKRKLTQYDSEWFIITNGQDYILLNNKIEAQNLKEDPLKHAVVFWFNISPSRNKNYTETKFFEFLSKDNLFISQKTKFFRDIAQYREWYCEENLSDSWQSYKSTLMRFFYFYSKTRTKYTDGIYKDINGDDFFRFINFKRDRKNGLKKIESIVSIQNNLSHLLGMLTAFKVKKKMNIDFEATREDILAYFDSTPKIREDVSHLCKANIERIVKLYKEKDNSTRNISIFLLCLSLGLERPNIRELKWSDIDFTKNEISINNRRIPLNHATINYLKKLHSEANLLQLDTEFVFTAYHRGQYKPVSEATINDVFDRIYEYDNNEVWKVFSPAYVRRGLIEQLFICNYSLDEIIYITGISVTSINTYISTDRIISRYKKNHLQKKMPLYGGVFESDI